MKRRRLPLKSAVALWLAGPILLALSCVRPSNPSSARAQRLPTSIAGFEFKESLPVTADHRRLLGTRDVGRPVYTDAAGNVVFVTIVFHDSNWKSLHPPQICIRGSNFNIHTDRAVWNRLADGRRFDFGHILATRADNGRDYVSLYAFVGQDFITPKYWRFYSHHFFPAMFRQTTPGFLLRVESYVGRDGRGAAERRCLKLMKAYLPYAETLIKPQN